MKKYWMVDGDKSIPKVRHKSYEFAEQEAKRLAQKEFGLIFTVLEAKTAFGTKPIEVITIEMEEENNGSNEFARQA